MSGAGRVADHNVEAEDNTDGTGLGLLDVVERWKQQFSAGRVSPPPASSAPGPVRVTTQMAWRAISRSQMVDCVCGVRFRVSWSTGNADMAAHQRSKQHKEWRERHGL